MKTISIILVAISAFFLILALTRSNSNYMNVGAAITKHYKMIKTVPIQFLAIFVSPAFLSAASVLNGRIDDDLIDTLVVVVSIFFSIFFAIMSILCSMIKKHTSNTENNTSTQRQDKLDENYNLLLNETFDCVMFESIISVFLLILLICLQLFPISCVPVELSLHGVVLYLVFLVIANLFVIIKRLEKLYND